MERYIGHGYTNNKGIAKLEYDETGTQLTNTGVQGYGKGKLDLKAKMHKDSTTQSEPFGVWDCIAYDKGILDDPQTNNMWGSYSSSANLTRTATHSVLKENSSSNTIAVITENGNTKYFDTDVCLELDFKIVDGAFNNSVIDIRNSNSSILNGLIANQIGLTDHNWHHLKIDIRHPNIESYIDNGSTPYTKPMNTNLTSFRLGLWTGGDITELHFKDVRVYPI